MNCCALELDSCSVRFGEGAIGGQVNWIYAVLLAAALCTAGCGKASAPVPKPSGTVDTQAQVTNQTDQTQAPAATQTPAPSATPAVEPAAGPDLGQLQHALARWLVRNRRPPANFEDFAATAGVPIPPPPPGKKYYIVPRTMQIKLVDR